jgi:hypothetical protein
VVVDACASEQAALRVSCEAVELTHMPAERLLGEPLDVTSPPDIARLMRAALASVTQFSE